MSQPVRAPVLMKRGGKVKGRQDLPLRRLWVAATVGLCVLGGLAFPASAEDSGQVVLPGYDLFRTLPGSRIAVQLPGSVGMTIIRFDTLPVGGHDFGVGTQNTGGADTIVRRLGTATPDNGLVPTQLVKLQMRSIQPVGYFVTLQSDRGRNALDPPAGPPSMGLLDIKFDEDGQGGTFQSKFVVNYDLRAGSANGPIVMSSSAPIADEDTWQHRAPTAPVGDCHGELVAILHCIGVDTESPVCTATQASPIPAMLGVDTLLNGVDESADFHPFAGGESTDGACTGAYDGASCALASHVDQTREAGWRTGVATGGPWAVAVASSVTIDCIISINDGTIDSGDTVVSSTTPGPVGILASPVSYQATAADDVWLCTRVSWTGSAGGSGSWQGYTDDDDGQPFCDLYISVEPNDPECSIWKAIDQRAGTNIAEIWQDCEPYEPFPLPLL